jgi:glycosyltransferase involved in cell wall biosynthesis
MSLQTLIRATSQAGYRPLLVCPPGQLAERLRADCAVFALPLPWLERSRNPLRVLRLAVGWTLASFRLFQLLRHVQPDIVHANAGVSALLSCAACALAKRPLIWHQRDIVPYRLVNRIVLGFCSRMATMILATSGAVRHSLEALGISPDCIRVFYPSVKAELLQPGPSREEARAQLGISEDAAVITVVGRLVARKAQNVLLEALPYMDAVSRVCVLLVGGTPSYPGAEQEHGAYLSHLHDLADRPPLRGRVRFMGQRDDISTILAASDIFVMPSYNEPLGIVMLEACAARVPVVAAASGGPLEVIEDEVDGLLVPPGDAEALAGACNRLLSDGELRDRLVTAARRKVETQFSDVTVPARLVAAYTNVLRWSEQGGCGSVGADAGQEA